MDTLREHLLNKLKIQSQTVSAEHPDEWPELNSPPPRLLTSCLLHDLIKGTVCNMYMIYQELLFREPLHR